MLGIVFDGILVAMGIAAVACVICMIRSMFWD